MSAIDHILSLAHHGSGCPALHGSDICHCTINMARGEIQAMRQECERVSGEANRLRAELEDARLMLRAALADRFTFKAAERWHGDKAISEANVISNNHPWLLYGEDAKLKARLADDGTGLPVLTEEARAALARRSE